MTVVVTGASGHVGANLVRALLEKDREVRAVVRQDKRGVEGLDVELARADVLDPAALRRAFARAKTVFHLAALVSIDPADAELVRRVNVTGARNVAQACRDCGVGRLVHFSSIHAFSHLPLAGEITETRSRAVEGEDVPAYDVSKADGEAAVLELVEKGLDAVIVNPTAVLGPHDYKPSHMGQVLLDLFRGRMPALVEAGFDWVDVRDVIRGAINAEQRGRKGERYLLSGRWERIVEMGRLVEKISGVKAPRFVSPMWLARFGAPFSAAFARLRGRRPGYTTTSLKILQRHRWISNEKARRELGYSPRPLEETIEEIHRWLSETGRI